MGLYVNTNTASINSRRHLDRAYAGLHRNFARLSSGMRINSAGDDAAGLAISERFGSEVRGLGQAIRNANDAISLAQVAEAALSESTSVLQRMRELAIQAANDINGLDDRIAINNEVVELKEELTRIADTTTFNRSDLLDGSFVNGYFQIGAFARQTVRVQIRDARAEALALQATETGNTVTTDALALGDISINGIGVRATAISDDPFSSANRDGSAIAKAAAINDTTQFHGVTARAMPTEFVGAAPITGGTLDSNNFISINGQVITDMTVLADDSTDALINRINNVSKETGVTAALDETGALVLNAYDGRNIDLQVVGNAGVSLGVGLSTVQTAELNLYSESQYQVTGNNESYIGFADNQQVGVGTDEVVATIDVLSRFNANEAILRLDRALAQVAADRASLGAVTNRMQSTLSNLTVMKEQGTVAQSRIRDSDFAFESSDLARNQILQQAGISVLGQANSLPQAALSLLQGG